MSLSGMGLSRTTHRGFWSWPPVIAAVQATRMLGAIFPPVHPADFGR